MDLIEFIRKMPKVELHVHLEGAVRPKTIWDLHKKYKIELPVDSMEDFEEWLKFKDFSHFLTIYRLISSLIRSSEDIEFVTKAFIEDQAKQNIVYTEVTYTPYTHYIQKGISFDKQITALNNAREWGSKNLGIQVNFILDISREVSPEEGLITAEWTASSTDQGVVALGLGGYEVGNPPEKFTSAFNFAQQTGLPAVPHAGETAGPSSIWGAINSLGAVRIGHGVRCLEDPALVNLLREKQIPLEVCPSSNICLGIFDNFISHPITKLVSEDLLVTVNSDDPALFGSTLTDEFTKISQHFNFSKEDLRAFVLNAAKSTLLGEIDKKELISSLMEGFDEL